MKKHSKILIIFAITLSCAIYRFCAAECLAQTIKKINLDDAIELSLSNNLDLQSARIDLELAKNDIKSSNRLKNPDINIFYNFGKAGESEPQQIGVSQTLEIAKRSARKNLAKSHLYKKENDVKLSEFTLEMDVRETYADLVGAKTILNNLYEQKLLLDELLSIAQKKYSNGKASQTEVIQAQIALNQLETKINSAKTDVTTARNNFNKALNLKEDTQTVYDTQEDNLPDETVFISLKTPDFNTPIPSFEEIAQRALEKRLDIKAAKHEIDIAQKNLTIVERQRIPDIEILGGYSYLPRSHSDTAHFEPGAYAGAGINNIPLLYSYKPEIDNAKLQIKQAQINYESAKNKALKDLSSAYDRFATSRNNLIFYKQKIIKDSEELIEISKKNYAQGKADLTTVIVMQQSYQDIVTGYICALTDYYTDWIDFLREINNEEFELNPQNL